MTPEKSFIRKEAASPRPSKIKIHPTATPIRECRYTAEIPNIITKDVLTKHIESPTHQTVAGSFVDCLVLNFAFRIGMVCIKII